MAIEIAYKPANFGPDAPHIVVKHVGEDLPEYIKRAPYGVWVATGPNTARPVGSGRGGTNLDALIQTADYQNANMAAASEAGQIYR